MDCSSIRTTEVTLAGFGDWLSVCSGPAVDWMRQKTKSNEFDEIAAGLKAIQAQQSKLDRAPTTSRCEEPKPQLAWAYCNGMHR